MNRPTLASLSPTLLARKGSARPAMRPQVQPLRQYNENAARNLEEDLGWNDMGADAPEMPQQPEIAAEPEVQHVAEIVPLTPTVELAPASVPEVVRQQQAVADLIIAKSLKTRASALAQGRRAAFTLRLDAERHLKLRLACVLSNRSAQQLVTEALDRLIADLPDVADLAAKVSERR